MKMNKIYTDAEYMEQGFTAEEVSKVRRTDILFNKRDEWTEEERAEYNLLCKELEI